MSRAASHQQMRRAAAQEQRGQTSTATAFGACEALDHHSLGLKNHIEMFRRLALLRAGRGRLAAAMPCKTNKGQYTYWQRRADPTTQVLDILRLAVDTDHRQGKGTKETHLGTDRRPSPSQNLAADQAAKRLSKDLAVYTKATTVVHQVAAIVYIRNEAGS